ncbi:nicotinamide riboside transporter PnuC [Sphingomonas koreensis]|nr:nicotinamide riboside transporter PnuC [Sphingomonas koreensis]
MSPIETIAFVLGVINIVLLVRRSIWNYPFALAMVALYARVFFEAKLYSDALLQLFFFVVNLYGWWQWRAAARRAGDIRIEVMSGAARIGWAIGCFVGVFAWGWLMHRFTEASYPWWDAGVAIVSIAAQIMLARRWLENWLLWIAVDAVSIGLYAAKGLWLTMVLYGVFLVLAMWGWRDWRRARRAVEPVVA